MHSRPPTGEGATCFRVPRKASGLDPSFLANATVRRPASGGAGSRLRMRVRRFLECGTAHTFTHFYHSLHRSYASGVVSSLHVKRSVRPMVLEDRATPGTRSMEGGYYSQLTMCTRNSRRSPLRLQASESSTHRLVGKHSNNTVTHTECVYLMASRERPVVPSRSTAQRALHPEDSANDSRVGFVGLFR
jgi:hypothetical protein